jgi:F-type H+-transporting ATPase subunit gamma
MATLRTIRKRIRSVHSTQKITKAMKMVAAARFRRAQAAVEGSRPYAAKADELLGALAPHVPVDVHPLLGARPVAKRLLVVMTSDRGLCGSFNASILRRAERELAGTEPTLLLPLGKKAAAFAAKRRLEGPAAPEAFWGGFSYPRAEALAVSLANGYLDGAYDRVDLLYNEFVSVITQKVTLKTLLPVSVEAVEGQGGDWIYEPSRDGIVRALVPKVLNVRFYAACLNSLASEFGARMTAMDSATRNAGEMIDRLTLHLNRARQATITKELMEIIGGAEALK